MRDVISVDPMYLSRLAASHSSPVLRLGDFLANPAPRYLPDADRTMGFSSPTYLPLDHSLPTLEVDVPADSIFAYKVFAKALLDGLVFSQLKPFVPFLHARSAVILQAASNPR